MNIESYIITMLTISQTILQFKAARFVSITDPGSPFVNTQQMIVFITHSLSSPALVEHVQYDVFTSLKYYVPVLVTLLLL